MQISCYFWVTPSAAGEEMIPDHDVFLFEDDLLFVDIDFQIRIYSEEVKKALQAYNDFCGFVNRAFDEYINKPVNESTLYVLKSNLRKEVRAALCKLVESGQLVKHNGEWIRVHKLRNTKRDFYNE